MNHPIQADFTSTTRSRAVKRAAPAAPQWPSYTGVSQFVGTSPSGRVNVFVDPSLGAPAAQNASDLVNDADRVCDANDALFGTTGGPVSVIVFALNNATDGTGGADHMGCDYTSGAAIEVCAAFGQSQRVSALFEAELSECSMGGNLCGQSTGEALSRWCAAQIGCRPDRLERAVGLRHGAAMGAGRHAGLRQSDGSDRPEPGQHRMRHGFSLLAYQRRP
jgi:hypothetical protein